MGDALPHGGDEGSPEVARGTERGGGKPPQKAPGPKPWAALWEEKLQSLVGMAIGGEKFPPWMALSPQHRAGRTLALLGDAQRGMSAFRHSSIPRHHAEASRQSLSSMFPLRKTPFRGQAPFRGAGMLLP